jgi:hypothetical protein
MREQLFKSPDFSPYETADLHGLHAHLREYEIQQRECECYKQAKSAQTLSAQIKTEIARRQQRRAPPLPQIDRRAELEAVWSQTSAEFNAQTEEKRESLAMRHLQALERFEARWASEMPRQYRKPSHTLLQLKQLEKNSAALRDYDRASEVHESANSLAVQEQEMAQKRLLDDYRRARSALLGKQRTEMELFEKKRSDSRKVVEARHASEVNSAMARDFVEKRKPQESCRARSMNEARVVTGCLANDQFRRVGENLLPPLKAPTDPSILAENEEKKKAAVKQNLMLMKRREEQLRAKLELLAMLENRLVVSNSQTFVTTGSEVMQLAPNENNPDVEDEK